MFTTLTPVAPVHDHGGGPVHLRDNGRVSPPHHWRALVVVGRGGGAAGIPPRALVRCRVACTRFLLLERDLEPALLLLLPLPDPDVGAGVRVVVALTPEHVQAVPGAHERVLLEAGRPAISAVVVAATTCGLVAGRLLLVIWHGGRRLNLAPHASVQVQLPKVLQRERPRTAG